MYELVFAISFFCKDRDDNQSNTHLPNVSKAQPNIFDLAVNNLFHTRTDQLSDSPKNKMKNVYGKKFEFDFNNA